MRYVLWLGLGALAIAGCGGGSATVGKAVDRDFGPVSTRAVGGVGEPVMVATMYAGITGVFGANFVAASVNLPPETQLNEDAILGTTMLAYSSVGRPNLIEYGTGAQYLLNPQAPIYANSCSPSFSGTGDQVVASEYDQATSQFQLFYYNIDGSGRTRITSGASWATQPSWSPVTAKIVFVMNGDIWQVNRDGSGLLQLTATPESEKAPKYNPAGTKIGYLKYISGSWNFWEMSNTGATPTQLVSVLSIDSWDYDPTGLDIVTSWQNGGTFQINRISPIGGSFSIFYSLAATTGSVAQVTCAPTGSHVAFIESVGGNPSIRALRFRDRQVTTIRNLDSSYGEGSPDWGPLLRRRSFIAPASGVMGTNAAGFLYGVAGANFSSFLAFDATTRNTVDIDVLPLAGQYANNMFATITAADSINMLRYVNGMNIPRVTVVDPATSSTWCQGALVSYEGLTGKVSSVVPFNRSRSGEKPSHVESNGTITFHGDFVGVFDSEGKKTIDGASELVFDAKSGAIVSHK